MKTAAGFLILFVLMNPRIQERVEMAGRFRSLEKAMEERRGKIPPETRAEINRMLQEALPDTFDAKYDKVNETLSRAACLARGTAWNAVRDGHWLTVAPVIVPLGGAAAVNVKLLPLGPMPDPPPEVTYAVSDTAKKVKGLLGQPVMLADFANAEGRYEVTAFIGDTAVASRVEVFVVRDLTLRLAALKASLTVKNDASLLHRLQRIDDAVTARPMESVPDGVAEVTALETEAGLEKPHQGKTGGLRRAWDFERTAWPARMWVPTKYDAAKKWPLVIALHGSGGSENFYFDLYGAGKIAAIAEKRGWIVVAPRNPAILGPSKAGANLAELVKRLRAEYSIDEKRIFITGHSLGGGQALAAATENPGLFAGVAAIAPAGKEKPECPVMFVCGDQDRLRKQVSDLAKTMANATYKEMPGVEHILVVGESMESVFDWLERKP